VYHEGTKTISNEDHEEHEGSSLGVASIVGFAPSWLSHLRVLRGNFIQRRYRARLNARGTRCSARPPVRGAEKRSQRREDYLLVSDDAPNGVWGDSVRNAVAAFLYFADRAAHSRHIAGTTRPARYPGAEAWNR